MVLVGGIIVDRFGTRLSTLIFALICTAGAVLTALSPLFPVMAAGRLIFGRGAESMLVAITVAIGQWFVGRQLGFAFGVNLSIARAGSYSADKSTAWFKPLYDLGWQPPLLLAAAFALIGVAGAAIYYVLERAASRRFDLPQPAATDRLGTAYGLMTMLQNIGLMTINLLAGALNDASGASAANPAGYRPMLWLFFGLSLFGFVFAAALRARETSAQGHGLESIHAGA